MQKPQRQDDKSPDLIETFNTNRISTLGKTTFSKGELKSQEDLIISGHFIGNIDVKNHSLMVEHSGHLEAEISVKNITIKGYVKGNVNASGKILIHSTGQMIGDIKASTISIIEGALFKGSIHMKSDQL